MHGRIKRDSGDHRAQKLKVYKKLLYALLVLVMLLSLISLPLKFALIRDIWFDRVASKSYHLTQLENDKLSAQVETSTTAPASDQAPFDPSASVWIYTIVASIEMLHTILIFFAFSSVYDVSPRRTLISALLFILLACSLLLAMLWVCCYTVHIGCIATYISLGVFFSCFAYFLLYDEVPIDFVVKCSNGKSTPLLTWIAFFFFFFCVIRSDHLNRPVRK